MLLLEDQRPSWSKFNKNELRAIASLDNSYEGDPFAHAPRPPMVAQRARLAARIVIQAMKDLAGLGAKHWRGNRFARRAGAAAWVLDDSRTDQGSIAWCAEAIGFEPAKFRMQVICWCAFGCQDSEGYLELPLDNFNHNQWLN